jgi:ABC-type transport system involved in cytochrome c biogenesis permease subunit
MSTETMAAIAAAACFLVAALACARSEESGIWLGAAGAAFLAVSLIARGRSARSWPLSTSYEFALAFALGTALSAMFVGRSKEHLGPASQTPIIRGAAMTLAAALIVYARLGIPAASHAVRPLPSALNSIWLPLHGSTAALSYGVLAMAGLAGLIRLLQDSGQNNVEEPEPPMPTSTSDGRDAQWLLDRAMIVGYPLLTLSLAFGIVWSWTAWGRLWSWDPKQTFTLLTWLVYTLYWPLRKRLGRHGRAADWLALFGLGCLLFTFLGADWLARWTGLQSRHLF